MTEPAGRHGWKLHPLLAHHVVNTLGWPALRPLQQQALGPVSSGEHALIVAPTAGGKTEAAVLPVLSRMLTEEWQGLSVLYLCPLKALLNNLEPRLAQYADLVGRRATLWHGDVGESARQAIRDAPPDILLTTPESIEALLLSRRTEHERFFADVRCIIVDEIHAFAGDDRGWHLLAVTERVQRLVDRQIQRVGLSATVGNAPELLGWMTATSAGPSCVIQPAADMPRSTPDLTVDHVGSLENVAIVLSRLHRGEKRLVFVDSRARVEELATLLRERSVTTFVSHGSLGRDERHAAEAAFAEARDCVIVATSTLELGIDVGDLDRVIQVDSPGTVAGFLQRLGRTGRRAGATPNLLFLSTSEEELLRILGLLGAWEGGFVEPLEAPAFPLHLLAQQLLAVILQEGGVGRNTWLEWLGDPCVLGEDVSAWADELVTYLLAEGLLFEDGGLLGIGPVGEQRYGRRNFLELMAVFSDPPTLRVVAGRVELGTVHSRVLSLDPGDGAPILLLGGRSWQVTDVDWKRRVAQVVPAESRGKARWFGGGRGTGSEIAQAIRQVLNGRDLKGVRLSQRATQRLAGLRGEFSWLESDRDETVVVEEPDGKTSWWTFAGSDVNLWLSLAVEPFRDRQLQSDPLEIKLAIGANAGELRDHLDTVDIKQLALTDHVLDGAVEGLKFSDALPPLLASRVIAERFRADAEAERVRSLPVRVVHRSA